MQDTSREIAIVVLFGTILAVGLTAMIVYLLFIYQRKRYRHRLEMQELLEAFNKTLLLSKLEIQEQTLDHISKELHANFSHLVSLININLSELMARGNDEIRENILETKSLAKQLLGELKALSASLNTDHIMHIGFSKAFQNEMAIIGKRNRYAITFSKTVDEYKVSPEREIILFRMCQEILNNILKHAKASSINVSLNYTLTALVIKIADDGIGFDHNIVDDQSPEKQSTGLRNIFSRANQIKAIVSIQSEINKGTEFIINVPRD
ncbi:MAG: hypothetical protein J0H74_15170 [Chitinophagaceae bacterium]|nr:hypothetical protein [Chitinophagaceae bacterium]